MFKSKVVSGSATDQCGGEIWNAGVVDEDGNLPLRC